MLTQINIIMIDDDNFKVTLYNEKGVFSTEIFSEISEILATARSTLEKMRPDPRSAYAKP